MSAPGEDYPGYLLIGNVTKPHGIKGEIKVFPYSGQPENFLAYQEVFLGESRAIPGTRYRVEKSGILGKVVILKLEGINERSLAEGLVGKYILLAKEKLPALAAGEFYLDTILGKPAFSIEGQSLGTITSFLNTGAHDLLVIEADGREVLVPLCKEFLADLREDKVILDLPPGLLDINS